MGEKEAMEQLERMLNNTLSAIEKAESAISENPNDEKAIKRLKWNKRQRERYERLIKGGKS